MADFKREEKKYVLSTVQAVELVNHLHKFIPFHKLSEDLITNNRSIYFDDEHFNLYKLSLNPHVKHVKLRFRDYGYKDKYKNSVFVEMKEKEQGISQKHRFALKKKYIKDFLLKTDITNLIDKQDLQHKNTVKAIDKIEALRSKALYRPILITEYNRLSFEIIIDTKVRITIDRNLQYYYDPEFVNYKQFEKGKKSRLISSFPACILETKVDNPELTPDWLFQTIDKFQLKESRFSKYTKGIESVLEHFKIIL